MASTKAKRDHCEENNVIYKIGEEWSDYGSCNLKICQPGGHILEKLCPPLNADSSCSRVEGDLNQKFPQCCPVLECSWEDAVSESSSSSSSDEDEDDLFDDDGGGMDIFQPDEPTPQKLDGLIDGSVSSSNTKTEFVIASGKVNTTNNITENATKAHELNNGSDASTEDTRLDKITDSTFNTDRSTDSTNRDAKDHVTFLKNNDTVLQDITNKGRVKNDESAPNTERYVNDLTEEQQAEDRVEESNEMKTKEHFESLTRENVTNEVKEVGALRMDVDKTFDSPTEFESAIENVQSGQEQVTKDLKDHDTTDSAEVTANNNCEESMDSINYSALGSSVNADKDPHIFEAMQENTETAQYKLTDYLDDIQDDQQFKHLIDSQRSAEDAVKQDDHLSSVLKDLSDTERNVHDLSKPTSESTWGDDIKYADTRVNVVAESVNENNHQNTEEGGLGSHALNTSQEASYKNEIVADGVLYNPEDAEGFLRKPEDDIVMQNTSNVTILDSAFDPVPSSNEFEFSSQPGLTDQIVLESEILDNNVESNHNEAPNAIDTEEMFDKGEEVGMFQNTGNSEQRILDAETNGSTDYTINVEDLQQHVTESIDGSIEVHADNTDLIENTQNLDGLNIVNTDALLEEQSTDFTASINPSIEDPAALDGFENNVEDHQPVNAGDVQNSAGIELDTSPVSEYPEELFSSNIYNDNPVQEFEETAETPEAFQDTEELYSPAHDFVETASSEVTEDQTTETTEYSSQLEGTGDSTNEVTEGFANSSEDTEEVL